MIAGLDGVVEACRARNQDGVTSQIAALLAGQGLARGMVERGYVPTLQRAVAQAKYQDAEVLAYQAFQIWEGAEPVDAVLDRERQKVEATVETLVKLRDAIRTDPRNTSEGYWCFPAQAPAAMQSARDGWGHAVLYNPINPYGVNGCHQGFQLISYGGDGVKTENPRRGSPVEIGYSSLPWGESWDVPNGFWRKRS